MNGGQAVAGEGWTLQIPAGLIAKPHKAWAYDSGSIARGFIGDAPITVIVQARQLTRDVGFNAWVREVTSFWLEQTEPRRIDVAGAGDAVRIDGVVCFDGLGARDDREHCIAVCAKRGRRAVGLTIRSRPEDGIVAALEPIVASFELVG